MTIGIGMAGVAHGHVLRYAAEFRQDPRVQLRGVWDHDAGRGQAAAAGNETPWVAALDDLLGDAATQAIVVGAETNRHKELCVQAARAGKDILLQKPMALTVDDCRAIETAVEQAGVRFMMAFQMRHDPVHQDIRRRVQDGDLGRIGLVRRRHCLNVLFQDAFVNGASRWHIDPEQNMGMFMDDATHAADWMRWTFGEPVSVMAEIDSVLVDVGSEDSGVALYRFQDGMMGILIHTSVMHAGLNVAEIYGDRGVLLQDYGDAISMQMERQADARPVKLYTTDMSAKRWEMPPLPIPREHGDRIGAVARDFVDFLEQGGEPVATAADGRRCVEMILAAYESARTGRRVAIPAAN